MSAVVELMTRFIHHTKMLEIGQPSLYEVLMRHGREMRVASLTMKEARYIAKLARGLGGVNAFRQKQCYLNAQKLRMEEYWRGGRRIQYWEGYTAWEGGPLPISHAWVTINGKVVDVTLRAVAKQKPHSYFGIAIPPKLLMENMQLVEHYSPVIEGPLQHRVFPGERRRR